jgi:hypothetical protein
MAYCDVYRPTGHHHSRVRARRHVLARAVAAAAAGRQHRASQPCDPCLEGGSSRALPAGVQSLQQWYTPLSTNRARTQRDLPTNLHQSQAHGTGHAPVYQSINTSGRTCLAPPRHWLAPRWAPLDRIVPLLAVGEQPGDPTNPPS